MYYLSKICYSNIALVVLDVDYEGFWVQVIATWHLLRVLMPTQQGFIKVESIPARQMDCRVL